MTTRDRTFARGDAERLLADMDLVSVGARGEDARRAVTGDTVTFARVAVIEADPSGAPDEAGEIRVVGAPVSVAEARERVRAAAARAGGVPVTAFALHDLLSLCGGSIEALETFARALVEDGLAAVAEVRFDEVPGDDILAAALRALARAGLGAWRATVGVAATGADRLDLIERAVALQAATSAFRAFAPLPRVDRHDTPSTGYDDVKTVAIARLWCTDIERIQVDWPLYGPKLAQVALAFGANDIDGVSPVDTLNLGSRRAPLEDIRRQITAAGASPVERDGRYAART